MQPKEHKWWLARWRETQQRSDFALVADTQTHIQRHPDAQTCDKGTAICELCFEETRSLLTYNIAQTSGTITVTNATTANISDHLMCVFKAHTPARRVYLHVFVVRKALFAGFSSVHFLGEATKDTSNFEYTLHAKTPKQHRQHIQQPTEVTYYDMHSPAAEHISTGSAMRPPQKQCELRTASLN